MEAISKELQDFLIRLGREPECVSEKVEHYMKHILHLLSVQDEEVFKQYYGLFGTEVHPLDDIAHRQGVSSETMIQIIETDLRRLAITPEWQKIRRLIKL